MDSIVFYCVQCGAPMQAAGGCAGSAGECGTCGAAYIAPYPLGTALRPETRSGVEAGQPGAPTSCGNCGSPVDPASHTCARCALEWAARSAVQSRTQPRRNVRSRSSSGAFWPIVLLAVLITAFGVIIAVPIGWTPSLQHPEGVKVTLPKRPPMEPLPSSLTLEQPGRNPAESRTRSKGGLFDPPADTSGPGETLAGRQPPKLNPPPIAAPQTPRVRPKVKVTPPAPPSRSDLLKQKAMKLVDQGKFSDAIDTLEERQKLEPDNENNVIVTAQCYLERKNALRAARILEDFLTIRPGKEDAQNALGAALQQANVWNEAYWSFRQFYARYDGALDRANKDGRKRWGAQWVDAGVADVNWQRVQSAENEFRTATADLQRIEHELRELVQQRQDAIHRTAFLRPPDIAAFNRDIAAATVRQRDDERKIQQARIAIASLQPHFPPLADHLD